MRPDGVPRAYGRCRTPSIRGRPPMQIRHVVVLAVVAAVGLGLLTPQLARAG
jgi:hypothetical protein